MSNKVGAKAEGQEPLVAVHVAGLYHGRAHELFCVRCLCLESREDFLVFEPPGGGGTVQIERIKCLACQQEHAAISAEQALEEGRIEQAEYRLLLAPVQLERPPTPPAAEVGNDTVRVKRR